MLTVYLNYSDASHVITGVDLKERLIEFRTKILKGVIHATWHPNLVKIPEKKGWLVKKENLELLYTNLKEHNISYTVLDTPLPGKQEEKPASTPQAWHDWIENMKADSEQDWKEYKDLLISEGVPVETSTERVFGARPVPDFEGLYAQHHAAQLAKNQPTDTIKLEGYNEEYALYHAQLVKDWQTDATQEFEDAVQETLKNGLVPAPWEEFMEPVDTKKEPAVIEEFVRKDVD
jgi:hypothetical protein